MRKLRHLVKKGFVLYEYIIVTKGNEFIDVITGGAIDQGNDSSAIILSVQIMRRGDAFDKRRWSSNGNYVRASPNM